MRYSDHEQRQLDIASGKEMDRVMHEGVPAQPGTPETDSDPRNPNVTTLSPSKIEFYAGGVWVLRITTDRVEGNPDVPTDAAAKAIIAALDAQIKALR